MRRFMHLKIVVLAFVLAQIISLMISLPSHAIMLVSKNEEVSIGKQVEADAIKQYGGLSKDPVLNERVARIGKSVAAVSPRKEITYTYKVVNSDIINAFAAPGGPVVITKKLAQMLSDNELGFVLAHETGHIAAQHGRKAINQALLTQGIASVVLRKSSNTAQMATGVMYTLFTRGYSREQEYQADSYGVQLMGKAGYNTDAAVTALAKLGIKRTSGINKYLATHPDIPDRINRVAQMTGITETQKQALIKQGQSGAR